MQVDSVIQSFFTICKNIKWRKFDNDSRLEWYYAENMQYVIHDTLTSGYYFIKAKSPINAYDIVEKKVYGDGM